MEAHVPEEIIREILQYCVPITPVHSFLLDYSFYYSEFDNSVAMPPQDALMVSKRWLRIGAPLFYNTVILKNARQVRQLAEVLQSNSELGSAVHNIRVEGGYGHDLATLVRHTPNVYALSLTLNSMESADGTSGMSTALPLLRPTRLYLHASGGPMYWATKNNTIMAIDHALVGALTNWTSLVSPSSFTLRAAIVYVTALRRRNYTYLLLVPTSS